MSQRNWINFWNGVNGKSWLDGNAQAILNAEAIGDVLEERGLLNRQQNAPQIAIAPVPKRGANAKAYKQNVDLVGRKATLLHEQPSLENLQSYTSLLSGFARLIRDNGQTYWLPFVWQQIDWLTGWVHHFVTQVSPKDVIPAVDAFLGTAALFAVDFDGTYKQWREAYPDIVDLYNSTAQGAPAPSVSASGDVLRPARLDSVIGQGKVVRQIALLISAAKARGETLDHVLLAGPPGLGKTTLSLVIANEMGSKAYVTSGPALKTVADLHAFLKSLQPGDILFVDEVHRLPQIVNEALYIAVEDFRADIDGQRVVLPRFTLIGATTHAGLIPGPLRDRFGYTGFLEPYDVNDLTTIVTNNATKLGLDGLTTEAAREIATRSRNTPRVANSLLRRVRDYAQANGLTSISQEVASEAIDMFDIDSLGLDRLDRHVLATLARFNQPVGLKTLAAATGEAEESVEESEAFMIRLGFIDRTPRGRVITEAGRDHLV